MVAAVIAEANRDRKKRSEPFGPWDFFSSITRPADVAPPEMSHEQVQGKIAEMQSVFGGEWSDG